MARSIFFFLGLTLFLPSDVVACSCARPRTAAVAWGADVIVRAHVVRMEVGDFENRYASPTPVEVELRVTRTWRGRTQRRIVVYTGFGGGDCGLDTELGDEYVMPLYRLEDGRLAVGLCSGVERAAMAGATIAALGRGRFPLDARPWDEGVVGSVGAELRDASLPGRTGYPAWRALLEAHAVLSVAAIMVALLWSVGWWPGGGRRGP